MLLFKSKVVNYLVALIVWGLLSLVIGRIGEIWELPKWAAVTIAAIVVLLSKRSVKILKNKNLTFFGGLTDIWIEEGGSYFLFFMWAFAETEIQTQEKINIVVPTFTTGDRYGKQLIVDINADCVVGKTTEARRAYQKMKEEDFPSNLHDVLQRTATEVINNRDFWKEIRGKNLGQVTLSNSEVQDHAKQYGIVFTSMVVKVASANPEQDDKDARREYLTEKMRQLYPSMNDREIADEVEVQMGQTEKIQTSGPQTVQIKRELEGPGGHRHD